MEKFRDAILEKIHNYKSVIKSSDTDETKTYSFTTLIAVILIAVFVIVLIVYLWPKWTFDASGS